MKNSFWYLQTFTEGIISKEECLCNGPMNAMCVLEKSQVVFSNVSEIEEAIFR